MEIKNLANLPTDIIYGAFSKAFFDYSAISLNLESFTQLIERRGFCPELSFGAFADGELVSFTLNGIGLYQGIKTAYDTGTGTVPDFRGQGLARRIFLESKPALKAAGINQYLLEVLQDNFKAVPLYRSMGFETIREFQYFSTKADSVKPNPGPKAQSFILKSSLIPDPDTLTPFHDFHPSWQNSFESISRRPQDFRFIGAYHHELLAGYGISDPSTGDITQLAVDKNFRRQGIATAILKELLLINNFETIKIINTVKDCTSINGFLQHQGLSPAGSQFEMICKL